MSTITPYAGREHNEDDDELLEVVTTEGQTIRVLPRSVIHGNPSLIHKVVHVLVTDGNARLILQKRSMNKSVAPGKWDTSVGGHIHSGETVHEALRREMEEELGIKPNKPEFLYQYLHSNTYETELVFTYLCSYDGKFRFNRKEITEVRGWTAEDITANLGKNIMSDNFEHEFRMFMNIIREN